MGAVNFYRADLGQSFSTNNISRVFPPRVMLNSFASSGPEAPGSAVCGEQFLGVSTRDHKNPLSSCAAVCGNKYLVKTRFEGSSASFVELCVNTDSTACVRKPCKAFGGVKLSSKHSSFGVLCSTQWS